VAALQGEVLEKRQEKAKEVVLREVDPGIFVAEGSNGNRYAVDLKNEACTCPYFQRSGNKFCCKHLIAAKSFSMFVKTTRSEKQVSSVS